MSQSYEEYFKSLPDGNPKECPYCSRIFKSAHGCTRHMQTIHGCAPGTTDSTFAAWREDDR